MSGYQAALVAEAIDSAMRTLQDALSSLPNRFGGFKREHTTAARAVAAWTSDIDTYRHLFVRETTTTAKKVTAAKKAVKAVKT